MQVRAGLSAPPSPARRWWVHAVLVSVVAGAVAYYLYNERRKRAIEAELVAACARDNGMPVELSASVRHPTTRPAIGLASS